jgi:sugar lactone lactonase YvrE
MRQNFGTYRVTRLVCICVATLLLTACRAEFWGVAGLATDDRGDLYIADWGNHAIRKMKPDGSVSTFAGGFKNNSWKALLVHPEGLAFDAGGNLYAADSATNKIVRITPTGKITLLAGSDAGAGYRDGPAVDAQFNRPLGVAVDAGGYVYVADNGNNVIRKIAPSGAVTTLAGRPSSRERGWDFRDGTGSAARFASPAALAIGRDGNIYVADAANDSIRKVTPAGVVTTIAGNGRHYSEESYRDGRGIVARFNGPNAIAFDPSGDLLVVDSDNRRIRKVTIDGVVTTVAATRGFTIAVDRSGIVYVGDLKSILRVGPNGNVTTLAGTEERMGYRDSSGLPPSVDFDEAAIVLNDGFLLLPAIGVLYATRRLSAGVPDAGRAFLLRAVGAMSAALLGGCVLETMVSRYSALMLVPFYAFPIVVLLVYFAARRPLPNDDRGPDSFLSKVPALSVGGMLIWLLLFASLGAH